MVNHEEEEEQPLMTGPEHHLVDDGVVPFNISSSDNSNREHAGLRPAAAHADAPLDDDRRLEIDEDEDSGPPTPRFMQDEGSWKKYKWVPYSLRRVSKSFGKWFHGPPNPHPHRIRPFFPIVQEYPLWLVDRFLPKLKHRVWLVCFYLALWIMTFALVKRQGTLATEIAGWGEPQTIGCGMSYWSAGNSCGIDGSNCRPFNGSGFPFRCAANCESYHVLNPRAVGDQEIVYRPLVVGGSPTPGSKGKPTYRGDSFICGAAIHAGVISNENGGCGVVQLVGHQEKFVGSKQHGIPSIDFDSYFPLAFNFVDDVDCSAQDMRWSLLAVSAVFTGVLSLFTASPPLFFFAIFTGLYWTVGMALNPPPSRSIAGLVSNLLGKFLPAMFCAWVMYDKMGIRRTLTGLTAQVEKTILWLGACWVGSMENYTLSFIPIQRLNKHDLNQQPGARLALACIILVLVVVFVMQIWYFRQEGRLIAHLKLYGLFIGTILLSLTIPGLNLRLHHYILALLLCPGTSMQTRPSMICQGLVVGLFLAGIARWGFHPVLQTPDELRGDAQKGTRLPVIPTPAINMTNGTDSLSSITFKWDEPVGKRYDGISILVNDVERFRSYFEDAFEQQDEFVWTRDSGMDMPEYFRFAFMDGSKSGDYTKAGIWKVDGEWQVMKPGPSLVKMRSVDDDERVYRCQPAPSKQNPTSSHLLQPSKLSIAFIIIAITNNLTRRHRNSHGSNNINSSINKTHFPRQLLNHRHHAPSHPNLGRLRRPHQQPPHGADPPLAPGIHHGHPHTLPRPGRPRGTLCQLRRQPRPARRARHLRPRHAPLPPAFLPDDFVAEKHSHWGDDLKINLDTNELDNDAGFERAEELVMGKLIQETLIGLCGWEPSDIMLFGFGQGGSLALGLAAKLAQTKPMEGAQQGDGRAFKGVVSIGGDLPQSMVSTVSTREKSKTGLLVCQLDSEAVNAVKREFEDVKVVRWRRGEVSMPINEDEVRPMMKFFAERLGSGDAETLMETLKGLGP
ncbi:hypothetical protein G7046_g5107 [Stylonectria norvegica]|nr:hypothetical protein G7046_g5107 [Stylonectria norvegica]